MKQFIRSKSLIAIAIFGSAAGVGSSSSPSWASSIRDTLGIQNGPGYVSLDPNSPFYSQESCALSRDGIDRRTPSCMLAQTYLTRDGRVNVEAIQAKVNELIRSRNTLLAEYCQRNLDPAKHDLALCGQADQSLSRTDCASEKNRSGLEKLVCKFKSSEVNHAYEAGVTELQRASQIALSFSGENQRFALLTNPNSREAHRFYEALFQGLEIADGIRSENPSHGTFASHVLGSGYNILFREVKIRDRDDYGQELPEATNLVVPTALRREKGLDLSQSFFSPEELKSRGIDVSMLDPQDSGFWRKPRTPIERYSTRNYNGQLDTVVPAELLDPAQSVTVFYDRTKGKGMTAKITVSLGAPNSGVKYKLKYKARFELQVKNARGLTDPIKALIMDGPEVHSETVVNNLANALGFTVSPTFYKRNTRLYFKNDGWEGSPTPEHEKAFALARAKMLQDIHDHGLQRGGTWIAEDAFSNVAVDSTGRRYLLVDEASFESDSEGASEIKIGAFSKENLGKLFKREFRGFELFYAWIADYDTKDHNSDLNFVATGDPASPYKLVYSAADMGATLGSNLFKDRSNLFNPRIVKAVRNDEIVLNYLTAFHGPLFDRVTKADARWFMRLAVQLSTAQIREAFLGAGYHPVVAELMTQKMLYRRDELARALGMDELASTSQMKDPETYKVPGAEQLFDDKGNLVRCPEGSEPRHCEVFPPNSGKIAEELKASYKATATESLLRPIGQDIMRIAITPEFFIDGVRMTAGATSFLPARYLIPNPDPASPYPYWLIDIIRVGFGAGVDDVFDSLSSLSGTQVKTQFYKVHEFIRVHPIKTEDAPGKIFEGWKLYDPTQYPEKFKTALHGLRGDLVNSLEHGDMLISSSYLVFGAGLYQTISGNPIATFGTGVIVGGGQEVAQIKRVLLTKDNAEQPNSLVGVWETMNSRTVQAEVNGKLFVVTFPMFAAQVQGREQKDRAYRFDLSNEDQTKVLLENLTRSLPEIPDGLDVEKLIDRNMKVRKRGLFATILGLLNFWFGDEESEIENGDGTTAVSRHQTKERYGLLTIFTKATRVEVESLGVVGDSPIAKLTLKYTNHHATRAAFTEVYEEFLPRLFKSNSDYIRFEPRDTNYYLGTLKLEGSVEFKKDALSDIFSAERTWKSVCHDYASALPATVKMDVESHNPDFALNFCWFLEEHRNDRTQLDEHLRIVFEPQDLAKVREAVWASYDFLDSWQSAQKAWIEMNNATAARADASALKSRFKAALGKINGMLQVSSVAPGVASALSRMTKESNLIRQATLTSSLSGFPGQERKVEFLSGMNSEFAVVKAQFDDLFVDRYIRHLDKYRVFFNFFGEKPLRSDAVMGPSQ